MSNAIIIAVKQGGGIADPDTNFKLRLAVDKARSMNMPKENIDRAIKKGAGGPGAAEIHDIVYEAYGPYGIGLIIEAASDNKQRTVAEIKNILDRNGGNMTSSGSVSYLFDHMGLITINRQDKTDYDKIFEKALDSKAVDVVDTGTEIEIYTSPSDLHYAKKEMQEYGIQSAELVYRPKNLIKLQNVQESQKVYSLIEKLEENDDVQKVHTNADFPAEFDPVP